MPKLGERRREAIPRIQTNLNLPKSTRDQIEGALDGQRFRTMTDVVIAAMKLFTDVKTKESIHENSVLTTTSSREVRA